ncbi:hypothetical protein [Streptomyces sp. Je 1-369]|uniref:hypothetical protein n=1 Tax=Streptomyces sp. Je 1-369 TaxID=2966192 RepID=UPI0022859C9A|nr:hypothetical protein [Streptomyces sp. Je 1-369]WAL98030.1 hypothetical protein NOO62_28210 [Streptomyces sp. Je 1-369]
MGTKTDDAAGEPETVDVTKSDTADTADTKTDAATDADAGSDAATDAKSDGEALDASDTDADSDADADAEPVVTAKSTGVGQGAAAVVSAALGVIGLSGGWLGTIAGARSNIMGQLETKQSASVSDQLQAMYGDSWQATALVAGLFALSALVVGFVVLVRPAFGVPGKEQAPWIKSVAWAGFVLGVIGLVLAIAKYSDLLLGLPSAPS